MNSNLTIVFVTYHSEKKLKKYLNQFKGLFKVIVVENSGNKELIKYEKKFSNIRIIINKKNTGFGSGANLGLSKVKTKYALHIDLDTSLSNKSIKELIFNAKKIQNFAIMGPKIKNFNYNKKHFLKKNVFKNTDEMNFIDGCCLLFNMHQMKKIGFFDNNFFLYFEETDLIKRCIDNSKKVLMINNIKIYHQGRSSSSSKLDSIIEENRNWHYMWSKFYFFKKHYGYLFASLIISKHLSSSLIKFLFFLFKDDLIKKRKYRARLSGCLNGLFLKKAWFRPKI